MIMSFYGQLARTTSVAILASLLGVAVSRAADAPPAFDIPAHYSKSERMVPMRDGTQLFTAIYVPKDRSRKYPMLLTRTPYSVAPYGENSFPAARSLAPSEAFLRDGYIFVLQDVRGANRSEGEFVDLRPLRKERRAKTATDDSTDGYDTIAWLLKNVPGHNGRVGQWGHSYPGFYAMLALVDPHPALKAVSPQSTTADGFLGDDNHQNGAFFFIGSLEWAAKTPVAADGLDRGKPVKSWPDWPRGTALQGRSSYEFLLEAGPTSGIDARFFEGKLMRGWDDLIEHPDYDEYWQSRNSLHHLRDVKIPVLNVGAWFDGADPYGAIAAYQAIERQSPRNQNMLVMGPWPHGGQRGNDGSSLAQMQFGARTALEYQQQVVFPFFQYHLKGVGDWQPAEAVVFETGSNRWRRVSKWPPQEAKRTELFLSANNKLSFDRPVSNDAPAHDEYVSDPAKPVPFAAEVRVGGGYEFAVADQRHLFVRPDVLTYSTEVLDGDLTIAGPVSVELQVATTGTDSDWFVKVIDVFPDDDSAMSGYQMLITHSVMRGKYRNSFSKPEAMTPGQPTPIRFELWDKFHTFKKGHRLRVMVHSSWFPLFDRNPQTFTNIYTAERDAYRKATQTVFRSSELASKLILPIVKAPAEDLP